MWAKCDELAVCFAISWLFANLPNFLCAALRMTCETPMFREVFACGKRLESHEFARHCVIELRSHHHFPVADLAGPDGSFLFAEAGVLPSLFLRVVTLFSVGLFTLVLVAGCVGYAPAPQSTSRLVTPSLMGGDRAGTSGPFGSSSSIFSPNGVRSGAGSVPRSFGTESGAGSAIPAPRLVPVPVPSSSDSGRYDGGDAPRWNSRTDAPRTTERPALDRGPSTDDGADARPNSATQPVLIAPPLPTPPEPPPRALTSQPGTGSVERVTGTATKGAGEVELTVTAPSRKAIGSYALIRIAVRNPNEKEVSPIFVQCEYDAGLEFVGIAKPGVKQDLGTIAGGETREISLSLLCKQLGPQNCRVKVTQFTGDQAVELSDSKVRVECVEPTIKVTCVGPPRRNVGGRAEFNLNISNPTPKTIKNVNLVLTHDVALVAKEATQGARVEAGRLTWELGDLQPREGLQLQVEFECRTAARRACLLAEATAEGISAERVEECLEVLLVSGIIDLQVRDLDDPVAVGDTIQYEVDIRNAGLQQAEQIQLRVAPSPQMKLVSGKVFRGETELDISTSFDADQLVFDPIAKLPPEGKLRFVVEAKAQRAGTGSFRAELSHEGTAITLSSEEPTEIIDP